MPNAHYVCDAGLHEIIKLPSCRDAVWAKE
jgi:hypothetical protein